MAKQLYDTDQRYGTVSRALHWGMAAIFAWQFLGMILAAALGEHAIVGVVAGSHASMGILLFVLALARVLWAIANPSRPQHNPGLLGLGAQAGHVVLHVLMLVVPGLALLRAAGSGEGIDFFGLELVAATGSEVAWMMAPANALHGPLAWALLVLIAGHITMALAHRHLWGDEVLARMGPATPASGH